MSDEYQPDDVVETQPEVLPEDMAAPEAVESKTAVMVDATKVDATEVDAIQDTAEPTVTSGKVGQTAVIPSVVSLADLESSPSPMKSAIPSLSSVGQVFKGRAWLVGILGAALVIVFLFLPPISLGNRISELGRYTTLNTDNPSLRHPDGLTFISGETNNGGVRVKLESVPQVHFNADMVSKDLLPAVESLPAELSPKSPFFIIDVKSNNAVAATLEVDIPNAAEPWETLDLYGWDGENWVWIPSHLDRGAFLMIADTTNSPTSVMVMQNQKFAPRIAAEVKAIPPFGLDAPIMEADVSGLLIGTMGGTTGDATQLPLPSDGGNAELAPLIRNWIAGRAANPALVKDMLSFETDRQNHVQELLGIAQSGGYPGLILDYTGLDSSMSTSYAEFVSELAVAFHGSGHWLGVVVDPPTLNADGSWDTGGYDWMALGSAVDQLRITMPKAPEAYKPGGQAEQIAEWAVTQVNRNKVFLLYSTLSFDESSTVTEDTIFGSVGEVKVLTAFDEKVEPGTALRFSLDTAVSTTTDVETGATQLTIDEKTYLLGTPQWLQARMNITSRYNLGGVVLRDFYEDGNIPGLAFALVDYLAQTDPVPYFLPSVDWQIQDPNGKMTDATTELGQPQLEWTAPVITGTYSIKASIGGLDNGSIDIVVSAPVVVISDTLATDEEEEGIASGLGGGIEVETEETVDGTLKAGFVADVTVPDNTRFEKAEQFTKTWRMRNSGSVDWPADTVLLFSSGTQMTDVDEVEVGIVAVGEDVDISVDMTAPDEDGTFKGTWQLSTDGNEISNGSMYVVILVGEPPVATPAPAPAPVAGVTGSFELGGHVRDLGMPYQDKMHYAGMTWAKTQIFYGQDAAGMVNAAHANGFKIQLSAIGGAGMVNEAGYEQKFASWLAGLAAAGADAIEVWNEPNIDREWQIGQISPQAYTNLLCTSYNAIKAANPGTAVISAAPAPTGWFGGCGPNGCDDQPWMEGLWNAGAANCMDYIGAHHNAGATSPSARSGHPAGGTHHSWYFLPQTELYYNIFRGTRQLFYTEMGYASQEGVPGFSDQFGWARDINTNQQAAWLAEAAQLSINTGMVRCIIVWNIDFVRYGTDPQDGFAIIRPGGGCAACETLHNVLGTR